MTQQTEPIEGELVPVKNQLVTANPIAEIVSAPVRIWRCGPLGWLLGAITVVLFALVIAKYDVVSIPAIQPTPQPPSSTYQQQNTAIELAKIEAERDVSIAWAMAAGKWGKGAALMGFVVVLVGGFYLAIRKQTLDEQRMKRIEE